MRCRGCVWGTLGMHQASFRDDVMNESWGEKGTLCVSNFMFYVGVS